MSKELLIARLRDEAAYDLHHETIALLSEAAEALSSEAIEQPAQQKPAFYRHEDGHLMTPGRAEFLGFDLNELQPLYTSPPAQRTWVGLTDEDEIDWDGGDLKSLIKAIEAKLKEKNSG